MIDMLSVGSAVRCKKSFPAVGIKAGEIGWVFEVYSGGVQIIFEGGGYSGFGYGEAEFLEDLNVWKQEYARYGYNHISNVITDHRKGFWKFEL